MTSLSITCLLHFLEVNPGGIILAHMFSKEHDFHVGSQQELVSGFLLHPSTAVAIPKWGGGQ